ncbi:sugar ABC transporter substrate-binding protein [Agrococcus carbonis]|uniref:Carbohydrate ABC transporter substrate-binding protein, CUT1 family n=1 Tax=Agrococcus carbonis TaxID=684552 RepID=A0A1H1MNW8_9MICO|nr:maltose ABC transporter substrate-binding protein [Agrococcus carbonis]SDR88533.1 carbohydrate ABC transporter substrate-binding protein, CUT1 family [Agrococcus carbonis]
MKHSSLMKVAGVGALALTLAACSGGGAPAPSASETEAAPQGGGELVIWMDQNRNDALADVIASFEEETGTTVEVVVKDFADIDDDLTTQAPSGEGPDVVVGAHDWIGKLVTNGVIDPVELGDIAGDFEEVSIQAMTYNGATYGVPVSIENIALVRNTDLAPEAPASWDELVSTGEAAVESGDAEFPLLVGIDPNNADPYHLYPLQASYGGPVFGMNEDGSYNPDDLQLGNEGNVEFAGALAEWGQQGIINLNISQDIAKEQFANGASPYTITGPWNLTTFQDAGVNYAISEIPSAGGQPATPFVGVQGFFISAYANNPIVASQFLTEYVASEEAQTAIYEGGQRAPALSSAFEAAQSNEDVAAFGEVGAAGVPMPNIPEMDALWGDWGTTEAQIISGDAADPAAAWTTMAEKIQETLGG